MADDSEPLVAIDDADLFEGEDEEEGGDADAGSFPTANVAAEFTSASDPAGTKEQKKTLIKLKGWPEFKHKTGKKCKKVFGEKVCVNWPYVLTRHCSVSVVARMKYPTDIEGPARECFKLALTGAVLQAVATGNYAGATGVFKAALAVCLSAKVGELASKVKVSIDTEKTCSKWSKI